jgi:excisionase family DNA binding protein
MKVNNTNLFEALELLIQEVVDLKANMGSLRPSTPETPEAETSRAVNEMIDIDEVCRITMKARPTIYRLTSRGEIPCYKSGKKLYFFRDEIIDWIRNGKKNSYKDLLAEAETYSRSRMHG